MNKSISANAAIPDEPFAIDQREAARLAGISAKSLERLAAAGEAIGRIKIGRRVVFHRVTLAAWLARQAAIGTERRQS